MLGKILVGLWIVATLASVWAFEGRYLVPVHKIAATQAPEPVAGKVILTVAWGIDCPCSQDEIDHLKDLLSRFSAKGFELHVLLPCKASDTENALKSWRATGVDAKAEVDIKGAQCLRLGLTATPTALVQDRQGKIVFRGSLHAGRFCHDENLAYAEKAIEATLDGKLPAIKESPYYGCAISF